MASSTVRPGLRRLWENTGKARPAEQLHVRNERGNELAKVPNATAAAQNSWCDRIPRNVFKVHRYILSNVTTHTDSNIHLSFDLRDYPFHIFFFFYVEENRVKRAHQYEKQKPTGQRKA